MKKLIFVFMMLVAVGGYTMIETISTEDLIKQAKMIVVGKVVAVEEADEVLKAKYPQVEIIFNIVEIEEHLTNTTSKKQITVVTFKGFEDDIVFEIGSRYLLFVQDYEEQYYAVFNSPQGGFLIEPDETLRGMVKDNVTLNSAKKKISEVLK